MQFEHLSFPAVILLLKSHQLLDHNIDLYSNEIAAQKITNNSYSLFLALEWISFQKIRFHFIFTYCWKESSVFLQCLWVFILQICKSPLLRSPVADSIIDWQLQLLSPGSPIFSPRSCFLWLLPGDDRAPWELEASPSSRTCYSSNRGLGREASDQPCPSLPASEALPTPTLLPSLFL